MKTYKEVMDLLGDREFTIGLDDGNLLTARCWTDDPEVMSWPASFDVSASWGDGRIGQYDNLKGELDIPIMRLADEIEKAMPGIRLYYDPADQELQQEV